MQHTYNTTCFTLEITLFEYCYITNESLVFLLSPQFSYHICPRKVIGTEYLCRTCFNVILLLNVFACGSSDSSKVTELNRRDIYSHLRDRNTEEQG